MDWREKVDNSIKEHLDTQIKETHKSEDALKSADDPKNAQLWIAIANLSKQINDISLKVDYIERVLQEQNKEHMKTTSKKDLEDIKDAMSKIMKGVKKN